MLFLSCGTLFGQDTINTDRPAFTNASVVVPKGTFQLENGFLETGSGQEGVDFSETQLRFGLLDKTELRFTVPDYYENLLTANGFGSGWSDLAAGVKQQLGPIHGFDVSVIFELSFPTGDHAVSSHGYDPEVQVPWSKKLSTNWTTAGMFSMSWPTQGKSRNTTGQVSYLFDRQLTAPWDAFVEYAGSFAQRGGPVHILHFGTAYKLGLHQQVDLHGGIGLSAAAPDHFVGFGYSIIFPKKH